MSKDIGKIGSGSFKYPIVTMLLSIFIFSHLIKPDPLFADTKKQMSPNRRSSPDRNESLFQTSSTATSIQGVFRYLTDEDFDNFFAGTGLTLINDTDALLSDRWVGLLYSIFGAQDQDRWVTRFTRPNGTIITLTTTFLSSFLGQTNCFTSGFFGPTICGVNSIDAVDAALVQCNQLGDWTVELIFNNNLIFFQRFKVVSAGPTAGVQLNPNLINPQIVGGGGIPNTAPGNTTVTVKVTDSGCTNIPLAGANVAIISTVVPGSGGHAHLLEQPGTGTFSANAGTTDLNGILTDIIYTAGQIGLQENIIATAEFKGQLAEGRTRLTIRYDALQPLEAFVPVPTPYALTGETTLHPLGTNHFATMQTITQINNLTGVYFALTRDFTSGVLKVNDMSLPFGGVFDLNGQLNVAGGHVSHETGIDVDIETADTAGKAVKRRFLTKTACWLGGRPIPEPTIHYRFDGRLCK